MSFKIQLTFRPHRLKKQDNADVQKLNSLAKWDQDTHDAILWVRQNRNLFKMEVFETPFMRLNVKDKRYTNAVEACINSSQLRVWNFFLTRLSLNLLASDIRHSVPGRLRRDQPPHQ